MTEKKKGPWRSVLNLIARGILQADFTALRVAAIEDRLARLDGGEDAAAAKKLAYATLAREQGGEISFKLK